MYRAVLVTVVVVLLVQPRIPAADLPTSRLTASAHSRVVGAVPSEEVIADSTKHFEEVMIVGYKEHEVPGSGTYMDKKTLEQFNQPDVNKILRMVTGVNVRDEEGFGLRPSIGMRGTPLNRCSKITLMEDGILIAPAPYADPEAYYFPTFARMEGVEVLKGSSQIEYGPYTTGGALNLLSTSIPDSFGGMAELMYGSFGMSRQRLWVGDSKENVDYVLEVNRMSSNGFKELDNGGNTGFDRRDIVGKVRWHTAEGAELPQALTLKFVQSNELANEGYLGLTFDDYLSNPLRRYASTQRDVLDMNHTHLSLSHSIQPLPGLSVHTTAYHSRTFREWGRVNGVGGVAVSTVLSDPVTYRKEDSVMTGAADGSVDFRSAARTYVSKGVQSIAEYTFAQGSVAHRVKVGVRIHSDEADRYNTASTFDMKKGIMIMSGSGPVGNLENQIRRASSVSGFAQYKLMVGAFSFTPGIRVEHFKLDFLNYGTNDNARLGSSLLTAENTITALLPGAGVSYDVSDNVGVFAGLHRGFSPPGMPSTSSGSAQASAEKAWNYELGVRSTYGGVRTALVAFLCDYQNILGSDNLSGGGVGTGNMFNAGTATVKGLEFSAASDVSLMKLNGSMLSMPVSLAYTYTQAVFDHTFQGAGGDWGSGTINAGDAIPFITPHQLSAQIGLSTSAVHFLVIGRYTGATRVKPGQADMVFPGSGVAYTSFNALDATFFVDATCNVDLNESITVLMSLTNVANSTAIVANLPQGFRPSMPRSGNVGLKIRF